MNQLVAAGEILVKTNAERAHLNLPPEVQTQEVVQLRKLFDSREFELTDAMTPSKGYFERCILQVETLFEHVSFKTVTN